MADYQKNLEKSWQNHITNLKVMHRLAKPLVHHHRSREEVQECSSRQANVHLTTQQQANDEITRRVFCPRVDLSQHNSQMVD